MGHEKKSIEEEVQEENNADEEICDAPMDAASANANADDDKEIEEEIGEEEEVVVRSDKTFHERMLLIMEKFASYRMGQEVMERTDRMLKILEDTAKWSLPAAPEVKLERPLPWIPFLALLILMRMTRFWCSVVSFATRLHPVRPQEMVYFFQNRRRTLRVVRINGLKTIRNREHQPSLVCRHETVRNIDEGFLRRLRSLLSGAACRPCQMPGEPRQHAFRPFGQKMTTAEVEAELIAETEPTPEPSTSKNNADGPRKRARKSKKRKEDERDLTIDEMLEKYGNENSNSDSDYDPRDDEEDRASTSTNCSSSAEETEKENVQAPAEAVVHNVNAENVENMENNDNEIKENGNSRPMDANAKKSESDTDSDKEREEANDNGSSETVEQNSDSGESNAATTEVASKNRASTPITNPSRTHLVVASLQEDEEEEEEEEEEENRQKSTPGHETAASLKSSVVTSSSTESQNSKNKTKAEEKCFRTITTQTCLEIDWSITIKTEITHRRTPSSKLENLNYSVQLTPATSDEDIFYSPIGSPQDFHTIFHPAPIVKGSTTEAQRLTSQQTEGHHDSSNNEATPETLNRSNPKKNNNNNNFNQNQKRKPRKRRNRR